jgi:aspartate/methionine/tyrosine aminotransferase
MSLLFFTIDEHGADANPKEFIKAIGSCGSYLDGGAAVPFQEAAIPMLEPDNVLAEMKALQRHFMV